MRKSGKRKAGERLNGFIGFIGLIELVEAKNVCAGCAAEMERPIKPQRRDEHRAGGREKRKLAEG